MKNDWDLIDLKVFVCVAKRSSFGAAAAELGISPAYVTKRIANLEHALRTTLFNRTTRRVVISDDGETALRWARRILEAADGLSQDLAHARGTPSGVLRISTSLRLGRNHVSHVLALLGETYPALEIWLELVDRRVDLLAEGFDVDIRVGEVQEPHVVPHLVTRSARVLCAAPAYLARRGHPRTLAELAQHDCLLFRDREQGYGMWRLEGPNGPESVKVTGPMGSNLSDVVRNWALAGRGIILLSSWDIAARIRDGSVERVLPQYRQSADVYAVTSGRASDSARLRVCLEFLVHHLTTGPHALDTSVR